jgi:sugar O-acyltransferase (sialic acid O-acetyltransferase NeuD family)
VREIVVYGSWKEFAQVVFDINRASGRDEWRIAAIADDSRELWGKDWHGIPIVESWKWLESNPRKDAAHCCIGKTDARKRICERFSSMGYELPNVVSPSATVSHLAKLGRGNLVCANVQIHPDVIVGDSNMFNVGTHVAHDVRIGSYCNVNSHVNLVEKCRIGDGAYLGAGCTVIKGATIGDGATVGANALVNRDVPSGETWVGIPARPLARRG